MSVLIQDRQAANSFIDSFDTFLFDCDGVIWIGSDLLYKVREILHFLESLGKQVLFVTNNSTNSRKSYAQKFKKKGLDVSPEQIFGSSYAAAFYLKSLPAFSSKKKKVYVIGQQGILDELACEDIDHFTSSTELPMSDKPMHNIPKEQIFDSIQRDESVGAVLMGFDVNISYRKIAQAFTYIHHNPECLFLATNTDSTYPANGTIFPGTGSLVASVAAALGRSPQVLGKPEQIMLDNIIRKYNLKPERTCMVGDRLDTDILFGQKGGLKTLCVLTGVTSKETLLDSAQAIRPDFWIPRLGDLLDLIH